MVGDFGTMMGIMPRMDMRPSRLKSIRLLVCRMQFGGRVNPAVRFGGLAVRITHGPIRVNRLGFSWKKEDGQLDV